MNSIELEYLLVNIKRLLGNKEPICTIQEQNKFNFLADYSKYKIKLQNKFTHPIRAYNTIEIDFTTYNIEGLKIKYCNKNKKFNIRRKSNNTSVNDINTVVIPLSLLNKNDISESIKDIIHGKHIISLEFTSMLKLSTTKNDIDEYIDRITLLGKTFYIHKGIDKFNKCIITNEYINIIDLPPRVSVTSKGDNIYPKVPVTLRFKKPMLRTNLKKLDITNE